MFLFKNMKRTFNGKYELIRFYQYCHNFDKERWNIKIAKYFRYVPTYFQDIRNEIYYNMSLLSFSSAHTIMVQYNGLLFFIYTLYINMTFDKN